MEAHLCVAIEGTDPLIKTSILIPFASKLIYYIRNHVVKIRAITYSYCSKENNHTCIENECNFHLLIFTLNKTFGQKNRSAYSYIIYIRSGCPQFNKIILASLKASACPVFFQQIEMIKIQTVLQSSHQ